MLPTLFRRVRASMVAVVVLAGTVVAGAAPAEAATSITINGGSAGRTFDGVGAVSGGGGDNPPLVHYPQPPRGPNLPLPFQTGDRAPLPILQGEVGGGTHP